MSPADDVLLGRAELEQALTNLGERLARGGVVADVFVVGGASAGPGRANQMERRFVCPGRSRFSHLSQGVDDLAQRGAGDGQILGSDTRAVRASIASERFGQAARRT